MTVRQWVAVCATLLLVACSSSNPSGNSDGPAPAPPVTSAASRSTDAPSASSVAATSSPSSIDVTTTTPPTRSECVARLPLPARAGQVVWPSVYSSQLGEGARYAEWGVGGVILMDWTSAASADALAEFRSHSLIPLLVATDEEGGPVQRLAALGPIPSESVVTRTMTAEAAGAMMREHAAIVKGVGIDVVLAPVVDVSPVAGGGPIGPRAFSSDPLVVAAYAKEYVDAWLSAGILPVLKHFPGHGAATADSHRGRSRTAPLDVLRGRDLLPYDALVHSGAAVMVGHLDTPGLTDVDGLPASLSSAAITDLLREQLGYDDALVMTDALGMEAITSIMSIADAAVKALASGADVAIFSNIELTSSVITHISDAVASGELQEERLNQAVGRVFRTKGIDPCSFVG